MDIRQALRDLADGYAPRISEWLERVAESDPAEAIRLWLGLLRFVTPTLAATALADITPKPLKLRLASMTDDELVQALRDSEKRLKPPLDPNARTAQAPDIDDELLK